MIADIVDKFHELTLTDIIIIAGILGYIIERFVDAKGWSRSARTLRVENGDLLRRNEELEKDLDRHEATIAEQGEAIVRLEEQVRALEKLDQTAVLNALKDHEKGAEERARTSIHLLAESNAKLERIVTVITEAT